MNSLVCVGATLHTHMNSSLNLLFPFPLQGIKRISHTVQRRSCCGAAALRVGRPRWRGLSSTQAAWAPRMLITDHTSFNSSICKYEARRASDLQIREKKLRKA